MNETFPADPVPVKVATSDLPKRAASAVVMLTVAGAALWQGGVVLDGRDIGTAVFPDADVKFYLDADPRRRALRRHRELEQAGAAADVDAIEEEIRSRDRADTTRSDSPLTRAPDAIALDTTLLEPGEVVERMAAEVEARRRG